MHRYSRLISTVTSLAVPLLTEVHGEMWQALAFRDWLRAQQQEARIYEQLKRRLATEYQTDREAYTDAKSAYVESVMRKAIK
jgi:GrpB-like predicted nucleotidyltransferase (UPF0157 family)